MRRRIQVIAHVLRLSMHTDPQVAALMVLIVVLQGSSTALLALAQRWMVDSVRVGISLELIGAALLGALAHSATAVGSRIQTNLRQDLGEQVDLSLTQEVLAATACTPTVEHLERPDYLNRLTALRFGTRDLAASCWSLAETVISIVSLGVSMWLLASIHPALTLLALLGIPLLLFSQRGRRLVSRRRDECMEQVRLEQSLHELCIQPDSAKEIRIARNGQELNRRAHTLWIETTRHETRARWHGALWELCGWSCYVVGFAVAIVVIASLVIDQAATAGQIVLVITLATRLRFQLAATVGGVNQIGVASHVIEHYLWLRDYAATQQGTGTTPPERLYEGIALDNISFQYPGLQTEALRDVTLRLAPGSTVGLVGVNGAGKSTLVKILTGVYKPTAGEITIDSQPLAAMGQIEWTRCLSGTLQDFIKLQSRCRESIEVGDLARQDDEAVWDSIHRAGATRVVMALPDKLDTMLGPTFDGVELSHGQWQKLALARAMMREKPLLLVLDEPTAALDPQAEHELFEHFIAQARYAAQHCGTITVLVSHRFSTVHMADHIVVLNNGRILEQGSHAELMIANGQYAQLFRTQAQGYG